MPLPVSEGSAQLNGNTFRATKNRPNASSHWAGLGCSLRQSLLSECTMTSEQHVYGYLFPELQMPVRDVAVPLKVHSAVFSLCNDSK